MSQPKKAVSAKNFPKISSKQKGDFFEQEVADVFRSMPDAEVEVHVKKAGKDVDIFVQIKMPFGKKFKIAVDAKDYKTPMTRQAVAKEYADYYPLIANKIVDQFMLVTRNGIVANAKEIFSGEDSSHFVISDLEDFIINPSQLINEMIAQFSNDGLSEYYVQPSSFLVDMDGACKNYDIFYSDFISFCVSRHQLNFSQAKKAWLDSKKRASCPITSQLDDAKFSKAISHRQKNYDKEDLEKVVLSWIRSDNLQPQLALLGTYGTGKSSFAKRIAHISAKSYKTGRSRRIPLLIELRHFGSHQSIEGLITSTLVNRYGYKNGSFPLFQQMNKKGRYLLILDGFDEMKQGLTQDALVYNFNELNTLVVGNAKVILCGRPTMFENDEEQAAILSGSASSEVPTRAKYIPLEIAPLGEAAILRMIGDYVRVKFPEYESSVAAKIEAIRSAIQANKEITALLSRPVHIPMFVTIFPEFEGEISSINRAFLYREFIKKIIMREVLRLNPAYQGRYSTELRYRFASSLAYEMALKGESRSVRRSDIPDDVFKPYVIKGESIEMGRRDLLAACFLDQKPPDILTFGHKSFLEFLVAEHLLLLERSGTAPEGGLYPEVTREIASFIVDMADLEDAERFVRSSAEGARILVDCLINSFRLVGFPIKPKMRSREVRELSAKSSTKKETARHSRPLITEIDGKQRVFFSSVMNKPEMFFNLPFSFDESTKRRLITLYLMAEISDIFHPPKDPIWWDKFFAISEPEGGRLAALFCWYVEGLSDEEIEGRIGEKLDLKFVQDHFSQELFEAFDRIFRVPKRT